MRVWVVGDEKKGWVHIYCLQVCVCVCKGMNLYFFILVENKNRCRYLRLEVVRRGERRWVKQPIAFCL